MKLSRYLNTLRRIGVHCFCARRWISFIGVILYMWRIIVMTRTLRDCQIRWIARRRVIRRIIIRCVGIRWTDRSVVVVVVVVTNYLKGTRKRAIDMTHDVTSSRAHQMFNTVEGYSVGPDFKSTSGFKHRCISSVMIECNEVHMVS